MGGKKRGLAALVALVASFAMALGLAAPAWAASGSLVIKINNSEQNHEYEAFQIFSGTRDSDGNVSNLAWGDGVDASGLLRQLQSEAQNDTDLNVFKSVTTSTTAPELAQILSELDSDSAGLQKFANIVNNHVADHSGSCDNGTGGTYTISGLAHGYYLVRDANSSSGDATRYLLNLAEESTSTVTINVKVESPTVEKKVKEDDKATTLTEYGAQYNDVADYSIGEDVPFKLIGTIPNMSAYSTYYYAFHDTASTGITLPTGNTDSNWNYHVYLTSAKNVDVSALNTTATASGVRVTTNWTTEVNNQDVTISINDLKTLLNDYYNYDYKYIIVTYNGTLNENAAIGTATPHNTNEVYIEYSNNPNGDGKGQSETDKVIIFTYEVDVTKVGDDNADLSQATKIEGAQFKLSRTSDNKYAQISSGKVTGWVDDAASADELVSDGSGNFTIAGLDDGTYLLHETEAPSPYQKAQSSWTLVVTATTNNSQNSHIDSNDLTEMAATLTYGSTNEARGEASVNSSNKGIIDVTLVNSTQFDLPTTGGAGTIALTVAGVALVAGAAIVLSIRKRANDEQ